MCRAVVHARLRLRLRLGLPVSLSSLLTLLLRGVAVHEDVGHATAFAILGHALVHVVFGELGDDVPSM